MWVSHRFKGEGWGEGKDSLNRNTIIIVIPAVCELAPVVVGRDGYPSSKL
jgi:hypothetical protein